MIIMIMKTKLIIPNENYEIAICRHCGIEFIRRLNNSTKQLSPGIRGERMQNCSKKCTRLSKRPKSSSINITSQPVQNASLEGKSDK